ncbi:MAG: DNA-3-methyladenine glycosylase family protein [Cypionkella sp.]
MVGRIIQGPEDLAEGAAWLADQEPRFGHALALVGDLPLRRREDGFAAVMDAIVSQQVSVASANAIRARMRAAGFEVQARVALATEEELRAAGLSRQKARYVYALAHAGIDFDGLRAQPDEVVIARLVEVPGIGRWTAEIYAMFALGRADVFAPNDLALQEAARHLFGLEARPNEKALRAMAEAWSPWRAVAARCLFAYYHVVKSREGI